MPFAAATAEPVTRACSICERDLPLTDENFYRPPSRQDHEPWCRRCGRPRNGRARRFGVEIEFVGNARSVERELRRRGLKFVDHYSTHAVEAGWKIVSDGSVSGGWELVSPPLKGQGGVRQIEKACAALDAAEARVDHRCGLHVHFEVSDLNTRAFGRLFRAWFYSQAAMDELVAPSRRQSSWAAKLRAEEIDTIERLESLVGDDARQLSFLDRYRTLNAQCFPRYGTVEARQHQGTINAEKIVAWVMFGKAMISLAKSNAPLTQVLDADRLLDSLAADHGLAAAQVRFLKARAAYFADRWVGAR